MKKNLAIALVCSGTLVLSGCQMADDDAVDDTGMALTVDVTGADDAEVHSLRLDVATCDGDEVFTDEIMLNGEQEDSAEYFADVEPGCYDLTFQPLDMQGNEVERCTPATAEGVQVTEDEHVDVVVAMECFDEDVLAELEDYYRYNREDVLAELADRHHRDHDGPHRDDVLGEFDPYKPPKHDRDDVLGEFEEHKPPKIDRDDVLGEFDPYKPPKHDDEDVLGEVEDDEKDKHYRDDEDVLGEVEDDERKDKGYEDDEDVLGEVEDDERKDKGYEDDEDVLGEVEDEEEEKKKK